MTDELKLLREKLKKKNARIKELNKKLDKAVCSRKRYSDLYFERNRQVHHMSKLLPLKYYEIKFKALNTNGYVSEFTKFETAYHAFELVERKKNNCENFELISIVETAS